MRKTKMVVALLGAGEFRESHAIMKYQVQKEWADSERVRVG